MLDLAELAVKADAFEVLHILVDYCRGTVYNLRATCTLNLIIITEL